MIRVTALYPRTGDSHFDMDYYLNKHVPMVRGKFQGMGFPIQIQVDDGLGSAVPGEPAPYAVIGYMLFEHIDHLQQGMAAHGAEIMGDIPNFTNVQPVTQVSNIVLGS